MARSNHRIFLWCVLAVVGGNYLAQIPYYLHIYYFPHGAPPAWGGTLLLGATLAWFLAGFVLLARGKRTGYWLLLAFLLVEVGFYLHNMVIQVTHGFAPFFHLQTGDPILFVVFGIGYLNLLCGLYFLVFLVLRRNTLVTERPQPSSPHALAG